MFVGLKIWCNYNHKPGIMLAIHYGTHKSPFQLMMFVRFEPINYGTHKPQLISFILTT